MAKSGPIEKFNLLKTYAAELVNAGYDKEDLKRMSCDELRAAISDKWNATADLDAWERRIRNETREECARVAESYEHVAWGPDDYREGIAAAIRALKTSQ